LGHIYIALVNAYEAHNSGGKFTLRFDDNQVYWKWKYAPQQISEFAQGIIEDINWIGIPIDDFQKQSEMEDDAWSLLLKSRIDAKMRRPFYHEQIPEYPTMPDFGAYPYAWDLTAEKVVMDFTSHINLLIRGEDLATEYSLYAYFCEMCGIPNPHHVYLPRLRMAGHNELQNEISKTNGFYQIRQFRAKGYKPFDVLDLLRESCLIDVKGTWNIHNIKIDPTVEGD
jgi:glutamyl/glutaminyl-tRNA synthetase